MPHWSQAFDTSAWGQFLNIPDQKTSKGGSSARCRNLASGRQAHKHLVPWCKDQTCSVCCIVSVERLLVIIVKGLHNGSAILDQCQPRLFVFFSMIGEGKIIIACSRSFKDTCRNKKLFIKS